MAISSRFYHSHSSMLRDARPWSQRFVESLKETSTALMIFMVSGMSMYVHPVSAMFADVVFILCVSYFFWLLTRGVVLSYRLPKSARVKDPNYKRPDGSLGMADGILYLGNDTETGEEIWFTNSDARTHCLYLGTTGSGKTFGLKSYSCNALTWASGYIYIDGKADTDLWSSLSSMARRFGRDDDLLIMNYMTGSSSGKTASNTMNPFSSGSASYITNMLVSLMPDSEGDNAMWKERAVALVSALMPCLVYKRESQNMPLSISVIRRYLLFKEVIRLSRDSALPETLRSPVVAYLEELPGYVGHVFDDAGDEKPPSAGAPAADTTVPRQQHGYLSMQFTRSMQSLGDDYGYIFDTQAADVDMLDVVLNRRILIVLIPALEKSSDEVANLGKIISSTLRGMMGSTLGSTVEGDTAKAIENKPTNSATPFIAIFDEVGYYVASGMAVMAAQARSLGFSLVFAAQDLPAMEKRVKEEARSITANCNIKLFGKLEDPTQTKEFFEKTVGSTLVAEVSGYSRQDNVFSGGYTDSQNADIKERARAEYDELRGFTEGKAVCAFGENVREMQVYNSDIGYGQAMRVQRFLPIPPPADDALIALQEVSAVIKRLRSPKWNPAAIEMAPNRDIDALIEGFKSARAEKKDYVMSGMLGVAAVAAEHGTIVEGQEDVVVETDGVVEVNAEAEDVAAADISTVTDGAGPMSWMNIIGTDAASGDVAKVPDAVVKPPETTVTEAENDTAKAIAIEEGIAAPMSWANILGTEEGGAVASTAPAAGKPAAAPPPAQPKKIMVTEAENDTAKAIAIEEGIAAPMSWDNIIGGNSDDDNKT